MKPVLLLALLGLSLAVLAWQRRSPRAVLVRDPTDEAGA